MSGILKGIGVGMIVDMDGGEDEGSDSLVGVGAAVIVVQAAIRRHVSKVASKDRCFIAHSSCLARNLMESKTHA